MAVFKTNTPVITRKPYVTVDAGLKPGTYRFRLVVTDEQGNRSRADYVTVKVSRTRIIRTEGTGRFRPLGP